MRGFVFPLRGAHCRARIEIVKMNRGLSRTIILHHARDLRDQRAKCGNADSKLSIFCSRLLKHNLGSVCPFWLTLFAVRILYRMQMWKTTNCCRKSIGKGVGQVKSSMCAGIAISIGFVSIFARNFEFSPRCARHPARTRVV